MSLKHIDHIVMVVFENRSFDSLLGYLYEHDAPEHFVPADRDHDYDGVVGKDLFNLLDPTRAEGPDNPAFHVQKALWKQQKDMLRPYPDPGEDYPRVNHQLFGIPHPNEFSAPAPMSGFVADYVQQVVRQYSEQHGPAPREAHYASIMRCFPPDAMPIVNGLARDFAVCDEWFSSIPTQTFANRSFVASAQSNGQVINSTGDYSKWAYNRAKTIFNALSERDLDWRIYWDAKDVVGPFTKLINPAIEGPEFKSHLRRYGFRWGEPEIPDSDRFHRDCVEGDLPPYTFIEPAFFERHSDMHPPVMEEGQSSLLAGEVLLNKLYEDLFIHGSARDRTLLVITFDEHGGCYDHVSPPIGAARPYPWAPPGECGFQFDRFGVRVPTIFVSPWIERGTVVRRPGEVPFDHTSVIRSVFERFDVPGYLTERDRNAPMFDHVLNAKEPRTELPTYTPREFVPSSPSAEIHPTLSDFQHAYMEVARAKIGPHLDPKEVAEKIETMTLQEALIFIDGVLQTLEQQEN